MSRPVRLGVLAAHLGTVAAYVGALAAPLSFMRAFRTCARRGNGGGEGTFEDPFGLPEGPQDLWEGFGGHLRSFFVYEPRRGAAKNKQK